MSVTRNRSLDELRRILGANYDPAKQSSLIGMENEVVHKYGYNAMLDVKPEQSQLTPEGDAFMKKRAAARNTENVCHGEYGWPVLGLLAEPIKFVQTPRLTVILYEIDHEHRQIFVDGRKFPAEVNLPAYLGYSIGRWEGDTLVVDVIGMNDKTWLDAAGHPHTEKLHVIEKYTRVNEDNLHYEATIDDPETFTKPWTISMHLYKHTEPNAELLEYKCVEFSEHLLYNQFLKQPLP